MACFFAHVFPCSRSNDRQPRDCSVRRPHTSHLSAICRPQHRRYTSKKSTCLLPPASGGVGSYRADATETARDRRACSPYRDEGWSFAMDKQQLYRLVEKRCVAVRIPNRSQSTCSVVVAVVMIISPACQTLSCPSPFSNDTGTDTHTHVMSRPSHHGAQTCGMNTTEIDRPPGKVGVE